VKLSKNDVRSSVRSIPALRFESQDLTSFGGAVLYQVLFSALSLRKRLARCVRHVESSSSYGLHRILELLILHLMLGWRRIRDLDYYRDDPLVKRILGLKVLPRASTLTRSLRSMGAGVVERLRGLMGVLVMERLGNLARVTVDFDGSVQSTKSRRTEGTAVGYNPKAKGQRSYYPLFATVAQTGQFLDVLHRSGNVHDSRGALEFIKAVFQKLWDSGFRGQREARLDGAHFSDECCGWLAEERINFSISVPWERFPALKGQILARARWDRIDDTWSYFEAAWKPKKWARTSRVIVYRQKLPKPRKGPIQLDFFEPISWDYQYKAVMTNKVEGADTVLKFQAVARTMSCWRRTTFSRARRARSAVRARSRVSKWKTKADMAPSSRRRGR